MSELYHHGIKGQRWGVRRWQNEDGSLTPEGYEHYYGESAKQKKEYLKTRDRINSGRGTPEDFAKLHGSSQISDYDNLYVSAGFKFSDREMSALGSTKINELEQNDKIFNTNNLDEKRINAAYALKKGQELNLDDSLIMKSVTRRINPNYGELGTTNNCVRCSTAMTLAKMGYSTPSGLSAGRAIMGANKEALSYYFDGAKSVTNDAYHINNDLLSQPKGSFGAIDVSRFDADGNRCGGHSMTYSILSNGSIRIEDSQSGKIYNNLNSAIKATGCSNLETSFTRLDNTTPNFDHIAEDNAINIGGTKKDTSYLVKTVTKANTYKNDKSWSGTQTSTGRTVNFHRIDSYDWERSNTDFVDYETAFKTKKISPEVLNLGIDFLNADGNIYLKKIV